MKIAISGKGGAGKTTVAALLINSFAQDGFKVIAIDADPDANLASALGFPADAAITPLVDLKELIKERVGAEPGKATVYFTMNPRVDDIPDRFSVVKGGVKLMVMGTIRRGGSGCACPENVMVRQLLNHLLIQRDEVVIMDMEAGIEHLGRGTARFVDCMIVIVEPTHASTQTFRRVCSLAADLKIQTIVPVANKVKREDDVAFIREEIKTDLYGVIPSLASLADYRGGEVEQRIADEINSIRSKLTLTPPASPEGGVLLK